MTATAKPNSISCACHSSGDTARGKARADLRNRPPRPEPQGSKQGRAQVEGPETQTQQQVACSGGAYAAPRLQTEGWLASWRGRKPRVLLTCTRTIEHASVMHVTVVSLIKAISPIHLQGPPCALAEYTDYTLRVLMYCAAHPDRLVTIAELAEQHGVEESPDENRQRPRETGRARDDAGRGGGLRLLRAPAGIRVGDVVRSSETDFRLVECF